MYSGRNLARDTYTGFPLRPVRGRPVVQPVAAEPSFDTTLDWAMTRAMQLIRNTNMSAERAADIASDEALARFGRDITKRER